MKNLIEPLTRIPGVRTAALVTTDGVLIAMHSSSDATQASESSEESSPLSAAIDPHALAGLATSWLAEVGRAVTALSWQTPRHLVLRAARGTMIVCEAPGALLCVVLESGMQPEELRLPMGVTIARMQRHLRDASQRSQRASESEHAVEQPPGIRPSSPSSGPHGQPVPLGPGEHIVHATGKGVSDVSGD